MRHDVPDIGTMSEAFPHLIFHNFTTRLGKRVSHEWTFKDAAWLLIFPHMCLFTQLYWLGHTGIKYPQVSFPSAKGGQ